MNAFLDQIAQLNRNAIQAGQRAEAHAERRQQQPIEPVREVETEAAPMAAPYVLGVIHVSSNVAPETVAALGRLATAARQAFSAASLPP